ncbi:hypothetical protein EBR96_03420 [bacterium]|nr:hypothetical protein [bacterium]
MRIIPIVSALALFGLLAGCQPAKSVKVDPAGQMVVYSSSGAVSGVIARIDINSGEIVATYSVAVPPSVYSLSEFSDGTVGIIYCRAPGRVAEAYGRLWPDGKVRKRISRFDDPAAFFWDGKQFALWSGASYSDPDEIAWMNEYDRAVKTEIVATSAMSLTDCPAYDPRQHQYWAPVDVHDQGQYRELRAIDPVNKLAKIDMKNRRVELVNWPFYWTSPTIEILPSASVVLVAPLDDLREGEQSPGHIPATLFWTRYPDFEILSKTAVPGMIEEMAYAHADQKVYLRVLAMRPGMKTGIVVVDVATRKIIRFLEWDVSAVRYVGNHRLAAIIWHKTSKPGQPTDRELVLIDTQSDRIVHRLTGAFYRIGYDTAIERYERF